MILKTGSLPVHPTQPHPLVGHQVPTVSEFSQGQVLSLAIPSGQGSV